MTPIIPPLTLAFAIIVGLSGCRVLPRFAIKQRSIFTIRVSALRFDPATAFRVSDTELRLHDSCYSTPVARRQKSNP
jgi:hypothetical protein